MQERQRSWSVVRAWTSCRVQASFHALSVALELAATASSATAASTGCTWNAVGSNTWQKNPHYRCTWCQGTACPLDGRPQREVQVGPDKLEVVASFCYLGDMLSTTSGCELSITKRVETAWKKFKELLPVLSSSHFSFKTHGRMYSSCAKRKAPCQWDLAIDKAKPQTSAVKWQGNDQTDLQCQAARYCHQIEWATCAAWHWWSGPHSENEKTAGMDMWNAPMMQSRQPLTYRLMEKVWGWEAQDDMEAADRGIAESGSAWLLTLMIDIPGDLVWDLPCVQQASYLEGGPLMWMLPLNLHVFQKSDYDDDDSVRWADNSVKTW